LISLGVGLGLVWIHGGEGKPGVVVDGDMEELSADALDPVAAVAGDAVRGGRGLPKAQSAVDDRHGKFLALMNRGSGMMIVIVRSVFLSVACIATSASRFLIEWTINS
jgi:hypothetical protein